MTTTTATLEEFGTALDAAHTIGTALDISPCEALHMFFPAIVGDDDIMAALATLLTPVMETVAPLVAADIVAEEDGETFVHNVYHLVQLAAALGHMLGVAEAMGVADDVPADLSGIDWDDVPDVFEESDDDGPEAA